MGEDYTKFRFNTIAVDANKLLKIKEEAAKESPRIIKSS